MHVCKPTCIYNWMHVCICAYLFVFNSILLSYNEPKVTHKHTHTHTHTHLPTYTHTLAFRGVSVRAYDSINHGILIQKLCSSMYTIGAILNKIISQTVLKTAAKLSVSHGRI